jgi:type II secretory pathway pseudopilin PulG
MVELLTTIAILGLLLGILMPGVQSARETARRSLCGNNLRQIGLATANFVDLRGRLPPGQYRDPALGSAAGNNTFSWSGFLLEFLEQAQTAPTSQVPPSSNPGTPAPDGHLYLKAALGSVWNQAATSTIVPTYLCPSTTRVHPSREGGRIKDHDGAPGLDPQKFEGFACIDYAGNAGATAAARYPRADGSPYPASRSAVGNTVPTSTGVFIDQPVGSLAQGVGRTLITDGLSKTLLIVELSGRGLTGTSGTGSPRGAWASGQNCTTIGPINPAISLVNPIVQATEAWPDAPANALFSDHRRGAQVVMCDGAVDFITEDIAEHVLVRMATKAEGESLTAGD